MKFVYFVLAFCFCAFCVADELDDKFDQIMKPLVRVTYNFNGGSGTVVYSDDRDKEGEFETFVLTNHHVVSNAIKIEKTWNSLKEDWEFKQNNDLVTVELYRYLRKGKNVITQPIKAKILAYDEKDDLALLELFNYPLQVDSVARFISESESLKLFQPVYAVGSSLLEDPIPTKGEIIDLEHLINGKDYIMASAQIIHGNSGGAVFTNIDNNWFYVGIPSRIRVTRQGQAMTHMGYFIPPSRIRNFIKVQKLDFLLDSTKTPNDSRVDRDILKSKGVKKRL